MNLEHHTIKARRVGQSWSLSTWKNYILLFFSWVLKFSHKINLIFPYDFAIEILHHPLQRESESLKKLPKAASISDCASFTGKIWSSLLSSSLVSEVKLMLSHSLSNSIFLITSCYRLNYGKNLFSAINLTSDCSIRKQHCWKMLMKNLVLHILKNLIFQISRAKKISKGCLV